MKRLLFAVTLGLCLAQPLWAYQSPGKPTGFVSDFANVLTAEQRAGLENKIGNFERPAGVEMAVVTVGSLDGDTIEAFAAKLFEEWGIGKERADNGILFLIAPNEREARIEVGYGLEPVVTDAGSSVIMRNIIVPRFAEGDYYAGIDLGVDALIALVEGDPEFAQYVAVEGEREAKRNMREFIIFWIVVIIIFFLAHRLGGGRGTGRGNFLLGLILGNMGGRGGSGRGGFGGFGGGRSGGGGSSGRW